MGNKTNLWPCDVHLNEWIRWRNAKADTKSDSETKEPNRCTCGPAAPRSLCVRFFEANRTFWPMLWKDDRFRATVEACERHHGLEHLELDAMDPEEAYKNFFRLTHGSRWTSTSVDFTGYWLYLRLVPLDIEIVQLLKTTRLSWDTAKTSLMNWHTMATIPAGALAVALNDQACKQNDHVLYMWVPIVASNVTGSIAWKCHYGTLLLVHKDWNSSEEARKAWNSKTLRSKYEWCRATSQCTDNRAKVLRVSLLRFNDGKEIQAFTKGRTPGNRKNDPSEESKALMPAPPYLLQDCSTSTMPRFANDAHSLRSAAKVNDMHQLHQRCISEWVSHCQEWRGMLAGLLSAHEGKKAEPGGRGRALKTKKEDHDDGDEAEAPPTARQRLVHGEKKIYSKSGSNVNAVNAEGAQTRKTCKRGDDARPSAGSPLDEHQPDMTSGAQGASKSPTSAKRSDQVKTKSTKDQSPKAKLRQTQISLPNQSSQSDHGGQQPWPEKSMSKSFMPAMKDWLIAIMGYDDKVRRWSYSRVEKAVRMENERLQAAQGAALAADLKQ